MQLTRTLIVDDHAWVRQYIKGLLTSEADIEVIGEAGDGQEAILKARELKPDLVLMDVRITGMSGIDAARQLKEEIPELKVIILTIYDLEEYREAAVASGASAYMLKNSMVRELVPTIRSAFSIQG